MKRKLARIEGSEVTWTFIDRNFLTSLLLCMQLTARFSAAGDLEEALILQRFRNAAQKAWSDIGLNSGWGGSHQKPLKLRAPPKVIPAATIHGTSQTRPQHGGSRMMEHTRHKAKCESAGVLPAGDQAKKRGSDAVPLASPNRAPTAPVSIIKRKCNEDHSEAPPKR